MEVDNDDFLATSPWSEDLDMLAKPLKDSLNIEVKLLTIDTPLETISQV